MIPESRSYNDAIDSIIGVDEGVWVNDYRRKDRNFIPEFDPSKKALLALDFDDTVFNPAHYKLFRELIFKINSHPNIPLICARNDQLCSKSTEKYNQALWPLLDLYYYKRWGLTFDMVMEIASCAPLKNGVVELFQDIQSTNRVEVAINSYGKKPFIERVLKCQGLSGIHVLANPIVDEATGQMGIDLRGDEFDPYDITQWPSEPLTDLSNNYIKGYPIVPATKGKALRGLEEELCIDPVNTIAVADSGGDVNMFRACRGLRIAQVNDKTHFLRDKRLPAILKSIDLVVIQPDGGFDIAAQAIRQRMMV